MQDSLPSLIVTHRKQFVIAIVVAMGLALAFCLIMPKEYLSTSSALPVNSKMMDKQTVLGRGNIEELYSTYGTSDDLDRLMAIMHSPSVLRQVSERLQLASHYAFSGKGTGQKAMQKLERNLKIKRSEYGELQLRVWDKDSVKARKIIEEIYLQTQMVYDRMYGDYYGRRIALMENEQKKLATDSAYLKSPDGSDKIRFLSERITENNIARINPPPALFVLSAPTSGEWPDRPDLLFNLIVAIVAAIMTMLLWLAAKSMWKSGYARP